MCTTLEASQKLEDEEPEDYNDDGNHSDNAEPFRTASNTKDSSIKEECAQLGTSQDCGGQDI